MNLQCPNCQKMLTLADQYSGQTMKCPLCGGAFTAPALPQAPSSAPPPPPPPLRSQPASIAPPRSEPLAASNPTPSGGYGRTISLGMNPKIVPWIAPAALIVVFFLLFFTWVGVYAGSIGLYTQNAWQVAFGFKSTDKVVEKVEPKSDEEEKKDSKAGGSLGRYLPQKPEPGFSFLTFCFLLLFFPALLIAIVSALLPLVPISLPPAVQQFKHLRWGILAALTLVAFLLLALQVLLAGFSLESSVREKADLVSKTQKDSGVDKDIANLEMELREGMLQHTSALRMVLLLTLVASVCAGLQFWLDRHGDRSPPRIDISW